MIATEIIVPSTKLKIKLSTKRIEVDNGTKCELRQRVSQADEGGCCNSKEKSSVLGSTKRGPQGSIEGHKEKRQKMDQGSIEGHKEKRQKMDRRASLHCSTILRSLAHHKHGWVFNKPVDPVALNIPDYFTVIAQPMDLGTIKTKLQRNIYFGIEEFAADVRLTFSNAMTYNPPGNQVHFMAKELNQIFERKWKDLEKKWKSEDEHGNSMAETIGESVSNFSNGIRALQKDTLPKKSQKPERKGFQKISSLAGRDAKVQVPKSSQIPCKLIVKDLHKGKDNHAGRRSSIPIKSYLPLAPVTCKCSICGDISCHCDSQSNPTRASSDITSEGSEGGDQHVSGVDELDCQAHCKSPLQKKSDVDSDGAVSALDNEHVCSSPQLTTPATDASCGEAWSTPVLDVQLSPKKALRAAMLKKRFADTILKAQQKKLLDHGKKSDPQERQLEKERLERLQREERARIEAQIKAAEIAARAKVEEEFKKQRDKEREASRVAIQKMERTAEIENNLEIFKELELLSGCKLSYQAQKSGKGGYKVATDNTLEYSLERLGLFLKHEYYNADEDEELLNGWEEGEIYS